MDLLAENTGVQHPEAIDFGDFPGQAKHQIEKLFQPSVGKHVVNPEDIEIGPNAVDSSCSLYHSSWIPVEIVIQQVAAILQVLAFR